MLGRACKGPKSLACPGQVKEKKFDFAQIFIRELAKEELNTIADPKAKSEIFALVAKLFPPAAPNELLPSRPEDAPRIIVTPDEAFKKLLNKAVRKIKASSIDGISTQALRALQAEDDAVAFIAKMIERIINAEVEGTELESLSSLLYWCCFLKKTLMGA